MEPSLNNPAAGSEELRAQPERPRIIAAAQALYLRLGIAEVTLAAIADYLRLPESTVRKWFPSKEPLVYAVVEAQASYLYDALRRQKENSRTAVEELLALHTWMRQEVNGNGSLFFQQLPADYPAAWQRWESHMTGFTLNHIRLNLHWGILQNLYREDLDVESLVQRCHQQMSILSTAAAGPELAAGSAAPFMPFLAGIVTPAGAVVARRLQEEAPFRPGGHDLKTTLVQGTVS